MNVPALPGLVDHHDATGQKDEAARWRKALADAEKPAAKEAPKK